LNDYSRSSRGSLERYDRRSRDSRLVRSVPYGIALVIVVAVGAGIYFWEQGARREARQEPQPPQQNAEVPQPPPQNAEVPPPSPAASAEPEIRHPLPEVAPPAGLEGKPVPPLTESDQAMQDALVAPLGKQTIGDLVISKDIARRIVATVDNLPRKRIGTQLLPVKPPARRIVTSGKGDVVTLSPANYARYSAYVRLAQAVDVKQLVALYVHFYPLFQQAYEELGYAKKYFNDRLVEAIDDILAAPDVQQPVKLVRPKVLYEFADPELEDLSGGQKVLIRMGPENAAVIKAKLREIRHELGADGPAPNR
jgi:hypothetical protein